MVELMSDEFSRFNVLQISEDRCVEPDWFSSHYVSVYGTSTSLDLQDIHRPSGTFDLVICNHVLEHVADDRAALRELTRVIKDDGFVFLTFPDPANRPVTSDWGFPREDQHGHYRMYGRDVENLFRETLSHRWVVCQEVADPATGVNDLIYFLAKTDAGAKRVLNRYTEAQIICRPTN
ncbi:MAG: class I SAM-dependent methyltransferase, partial [Hyphomonas sp.]|nr:class I SAM-dependent methyltransferase [Hyphomonas sp.]